MSCSASEVVSTTTGIVFSASSAFISASTWRPSFLGRLRSSSTMSGVGAAAWPPSRRRNWSASTPSFAWCRLLRILPSLRASCVSRASPRLSSTSRISTGRLRSNIAVMSSSQDRES
jgi:hypothetical protein